MLFPLPLSKCGKRNRSLPSRLQPPRGKISARDTDQVEPSRPRGDLIVIPFSDHRSEGWEGDGGGGGAAQRVDFSSLRDYVIIYNAVFLRSCAPDIIVTPGERRLSAAALRPAEREALPSSRCTFNRA